MRRDVAKKKSQTYSCKEHSDYVDRIINGTSSGGYTCRCTTGYDENPCISDGCQGISISMFVLLVGIFWLYCGMKRRKFEQLKEKYFKENDGEKLREKTGYSQGICRDSSQDLYHGRPQAGHKQLPQRWNPW